MAKSGGKYIEGYLPEYQNEIDASIVALTHTGLTKKYYDQIQANIAQSWTIDESGKVYIFNLDQRFNSEELKNILIESGQDWTNVTISTPDSSTLRFDLKKPFAPLITTLANPIFPYGGYTLTSRNDTEAVLKINPNALVKPLIGEINFIKYPDITKLNKSLVERRIDGALGVTNNFVGYDNYALNLHKQPALICNLRQAPCNDNSWRQIFFSNEKFLQTQNIEIIAVDSPNNREILSRQSILFSQQNIEVNINFVDLDQLNLDILPERKYQLLFIGVDYGIDYDLYPFWHSSQSEYPGLNLAGVNNYELDQLIERDRITSDKAKKEVYRQDAQQIVDSEKLIKYFDPLTENYILAKKIKHPEFKSGLTNTADRFSEFEEWYILTKRVLINK